MTGRSRGAGGDRADREDSATKLQAVVVSVEKAMANAINSKVAAAKRTAASGATLHLTGSGATTEALMKSMAASVGWTGAQWTALYNVEMDEAGFNLGAVNPTSGAYGMAQFINGPSEYAQYGGNATTAAGQAVAMINYIKSRYGTPAAARQHEQHFGWYDPGGMLMGVGRRWRMNNTGQPEMARLAASARPPDQQHGAPRRI